MTEIIERLKNQGNGANVHTAHKCIFYLESFERHNKQDEMKKLIQLANEALDTNDFSKIKDYLSGKW